MALKYFIFTFLFVSIAVAGFFEAGKLQKTRTQVFVSSDFIPGDQPSEVTNEPEKLWIVHAGDGFAVNFIGRLGTVYRIEATTQPFGTWTNVWEGTVNSYHTFLRVGNEMEWIDYIPVENFKPMSLGVYSPSDVKWFFRLLTI